jgi:membrane fusion protein (multidrug efflux system)
MQRADVQLLDQKDRLQASGLRLRAAIAGPMARAPSPAVRNDARRLMRGGLAVSMTVFAALASCKRPGEERPQAPAEPATEATAVREGAVAPEGAAAPAGPTGAGTEAETETAAGTAAAVGSATGVGTATQEGTAALQPGEPGHSAASSGQAGAVSAAAVAPGGGFEVSAVARAMRDSRLSMKAGGVLRSIKVREGAWVTAGQPLCSLDTVDLSIRVEGAQVAQKQAQAAVKNAQQDLKRAQDLYKGGAAADQMMEKAELALTMANLQADAARVALKAAQQALDDATLRAPFAGVITKVLAEEGMMVTTMPPTAIFQLVDTSVLEVRAPIPERMLSQVRVGQPVVVLLPAVKVERQAKIDRIPEVVDPATRSVEAVIRLDNKDRSLPAGLYARVRLTGVHPAQAAAMPEEALSGGR